MFETVVPSLVGLEVTGAAPGTRTRRLPVPNGTPLVVECSGGRLSGRTALLAGLDARYAAHLRRASADLGRPDLGRADLALAADDEDPARRNASHASDLLFHLRHELSRRPGDFGGSIAFPRLTQGLLAVTSWQAVGAGEQEAAAGRLESLLGESIPVGPARRARVVQWIRQAAPGPAAAAGPGAGAYALVARLVDLVTPELLGPAAHRRGLRWWAAREVAGPGTDHVQLSELARRFRGDPDDREAAERQLMAAFLADIDSHYPLWDRLNRLPRPLLLLDNAHTRLGRPVLRTLLQAWHDEPAGTRPGVITTVLAGEPSDSGPDDTAPSTRRAAGPFWRQDRPGTAAGWTVRLPLAGLGLEEVTLMFGTEHPPPGTARVIHRLSAGRAGIAHALVEAARKAVRQRDSAEPRWLLDLPAHDAPARTVHEQLLRVLVPEERDLDRLMYYCQALDDGAADLLGTNYPPTDRSPLNVQEARRLLERNHWAATAHQTHDAPFVQDRTLRTLLGHRLAVQVAGRLGTQTWLDLHGTVRARYAPNAAGLPDQALYHALAVHDTGAVARTLHQRLTERSAADWLASVNLICSAPHPPGPLPTVGGTDEQCRACQYGEGAVHQAIDRLVGSLWVQSHPLSAPTAVWIDSIRLQLLTLAQHTGAGDQAVFFQAHETWPGRLRRWHQAPDLPT
ncbi:hypothetical protein [Kitasatospora purpeofusca]|uniref:hypothetical protein n=1 Tax=Kitasatospora purpeofusca TaxID=67352 RepID=UPI00386605F6|nr:hypothetical protein OIP63_36950 [Kitasatospora purpeofusca]